MQLERVQQQIRQDFEGKHLGLIQSFVRQPSISNQGIGMAEMAGLVAATIRNLGGTAQVVPTAGWPVVYGKVDVGAPRTLLLYGMYDVQPVGEPDWVVDPFSGAIREMPGLGLCLVGRGATNSKGPMAGFFNVLDSIRGAGEQIPVNILFVIEGEEEMGSRHLPDFIQAHKEELTACDAAFFPFFTQPIHGDPTIVLGVKGLLYMEWTCRGGEWGGPSKRSIHGAEHAWFASPAWKLVQALASLKDGKRIAVEGIYDQVRGPSPADERALDDLAKRFDLNQFLLEHDAVRFKHDLPPRDMFRHYMFDPILNIDGIIGGYTGEGSKTLLPHKVTAKIDIRMPPAMDRDKTVEQFRRHLDTHGFKEVEIKIMGNYPWSKVPTDHPLVQIGWEAYRRHGFNPLVWPSLNGSAPFYLFNETLGVPYIMCGPGHGARQHSSNEYFTIAGFSAFEEWTATFIDLFARGPQGN